MNKIFLTLFFQFPILCFSQNLLLNGGFEEENICTEYKINCAAEAWTSSSDGFNNYFRNDGRAYEGTHCLAIEAGHRSKPFQRTFIRSQLTCSLRKGNQYRLSLYVKSPHTILDSIGINFTKGDPLLENRSLQLINPSVWLFRGTGGFTKDSNWQRVELLYTATGDEAFLSIGNFSKRNITGPTGIELEAHFFVFVDAVSLTPLNEYEKICDDWLIVKQELYEQDERHEFLRRSLNTQKVQPRKLALTATKILLTDTLLLPDVLFESGKKDIHPSGFAVLDDFYQKIKGRIIDSIIIEGHTDSTGSAEMNEQLSVERAQSVKTHLQRCISTAQNSIAIKGWGSRKPVADNRTVPGRQQNRRVEILFYIRE